MVTVRAPVRQRGELEKPTWWQPGSNDAYEWGKRGVDAKARGREVYYN